MTHRQPGRIRLAAVGDLLLTLPPSGHRYPRSEAMCSPEVQSVLAGCDVAFGNLECTLPGDGRHVATEPRVVVDRDLVRQAVAGRFHVVTLANNHTFDCFEPGFLSMRSLLEELGVRHFGAGMNLAEAEAPAVLEVNGLRLAFLGAVDKCSGPYRFATQDGWGVAPLDIDRLTGQVRQLRSEADHVLVSLHWGEERFSLPSPEQVRQARQLAEAGASLVLGHHPHVLQGMEIWQGTPIIYSLGNFFADPVHFSDGDAIVWNRTGQTGCILLAKLAENAVQGVQQVPTHDAGSVVKIDRTGFGEARIARTNRAVARGVTPRGYRREGLWVKVVKPSLGKLRWSKLKKLRGRHIRNALVRLASLLRAR